MDIGQLRESHKGSRWVERCVCRVGYAGKSALAHVLELGAFGWTDEAVA